MLHWEKLDTKHRLYPFAEELLHTAFPANERRDDAQQREYTDHKTEFSAYALTNGYEPIGLITCWHFCGGGSPDSPDFVYVEHLAVSPNQRNDGYGAEILRSLKAQHQGIIVLEVELPQDEMSRRRIAFYEHNGFRLCPTPYLQPPYRPHDTPLPMYLMFYGTNSLSPFFNDILNRIHLRVYGVNLLHEICCIPSLKFVPLQGMEKLAMNIPTGSDKESIKTREKIIKDFYVHWIAENPSKRIWNEHLQDYILVKFISINETYNKASRRYESTLAVFRLTEVLRNAILIEKKDAKPNDRNQKKFSSLLIMRYDNIKLIVGIQRSNQDKVQYCLSSIGNIQNTK